MQPIGYRLMIKPLGATANVSGASGVASGYPDNWYFMDQDLFLDLLIVYSLISNLIHTRV